MFNWTTSQLLEAHYLELDASFQIMETYVLLVGHGIIHNKSGPLPITITNRESKDLYDIVFTQFEDALQEELMAGEAINANPNKLEIDVKENGR